MVVGLVWFLGGGVLSSPAEATHEPDHRFTVTGYVRSTDGKPLADARVYVRDLRDKRIEGVTTYTDGNGHYKAILHLHNDNLGDPLEVTVRQESTGYEATQEVRAEFDPNDQEGDRQATVHFGPVDQARTDESGYGPYAVGGAMVGVMIVAAMAWSRRRPKAGSKRRTQKR